MERRQLGPGGLNKPAPGLWGSSINPLAKRKVLIARLKGATVESRAKLMSGIHREAKLSYAMLRCVLA